MNRRSLICFPLALVVLGALACDGNDGPSDDPACESLSQAQLDEVSDALLPMVQLLSTGQVSAAGVTAQVDEQAMEASLTYAAFSGPKSGAELSGSMEMSNQISGSQAALHVTAALSLSGGASSTMKMDFRLELPWDAEEGEFAGPPTDIDGTISLDGTVCAASRFPDLVPEPAGDPEPHFLIAGMEGHVPYSEDGSSWDTTYGPDVTGVDVDLRGIACDGQGLCVLVGADGKVVLRAADGSWSSTTVGAPTPLFDVCTCGGTWLAVGDGGAIYASTDGGQSWSEQTSPLQDHLRGVACQGQTFVVGGYNGALLRGSPGAGFVSVSGAPTPSPFISVTTDGQGVWIAVGEGGGVVRSPDDGQSWTVIDTGRSEHLAHVAFSSGRYIAVGQGPSMGWGQPPVMLRSDDGGASWTEVTLPGELAGLDKPLGAVGSDGQGRWVAMGNGGDFLLSTDNGDSWSVAQLDTWGSYDIAYLP